MKMLFILATLRNPGLELLSMGGITQNRLLILVAGKCSNDRYCVGQNVAFDKAIEIVKGGGVDE